MKSWANPIVVVVVVVVEVTIRVHVPHVVVVSRPKPVKAKQRLSTRNHFLVFPYMLFSKAFLLLSEIFLTKFSSRRTWNDFFSEKSFLAHFVLRYQRLRFL